MIKDALGQILDQEMSQFIDSEKDQGNSPKRNGTSKKNVKTAYGEIPIEIPRDRSSNFQSGVLKKKAIVEEGLESQIISMFAKGMSVRDITDHVQTLYGITMSPVPISNITDKVMEDANEWFRRTLESFYPVVYLDAVHFKVSEDNRIVTKAAYAALGITKKWSMPYQDWRETYDQFAIESGDRVTIA